MHLRNLSALTRSTVVGVFVLLPFVASAEPVLQAFPRAELVQQVAADNADHGVVIGSIRRINNQLRAEREVRAAGDLLRRTWQIPDGHTADEAFRQAKGQLLERPHRVLFFCEGRECGSSSLWANQVLNFSRLYGPEDNQAYLALRLDEQPQRFVAIYSITRGNRRVYLHADEFVPETPVEEDILPTPATLLKLLQADGVLELPEVVLENAVEQAAQPWVDVLVRMLRSDVRVRVRIDGAGAPALINALQAGGIHAQRLDIGQPDPASGIRITRL
ncbi:MAG: DUF4892 domain-containing protein [Halopseudomonas yangmingensis]